MYCEDHAPLHYKDSKSTKEKGYNHRWKLARKAYLHSHPLCVRCQAVGRLTPATVVDHIKPHRGSWPLFIDPANHQSLCKHHHDQKTAREQAEERRKSVGN